MNGEVRPAVLDRSYRITLPREVREALGIGEGDYVGFRVEGKRVVLARAKWQLEA